VISRLAKRILASLTAMMPASARLFLAGRLARESMQRWWSARRESLAALYLSGKGIEIGALNNPLSLPAGVKVTYVDCVPMEKLKTAYPDVQKITPPDVVEDGEVLSSFANASQDFVVANHFLEHSQDPIRTIRTFLRILKIGGIAFMALPDKRMTFDIDRPVTPFEHLMKDYTEGPEWSKRDHFREAIKDIVGITDPDLIERCVDREIQEVGNTHYHVWRQEDILTFAARLKTDVGLDVEVEAYVSCPEQGEGILILRKGEAGKDRRLAEASLRYARESYRQRYANRPPL